MRNDDRDKYRYDRDEVPPEYLDNVSVEVTKPPITLNPIEEKLKRKIFTEAFSDPGQPVCRKGTSLLDTAINEGFVDEPDEYTGPSRLEGCFPPVDLKFRPIYDGPTQDTKAETPPSNVKWNPELFVEVPPEPSDEVFRRGFVNLLSSPECSRTQMGVPNDEPGGLHFDGGKLRMDLIPPEAEVALAEVLTFGMNKYAERNWENGIKYSRLYGSLRRHLKEWALGNYNDPESGLLHLKHALWNLMAITVFEMRGLHHLDDFTQKAEKDANPETESPY